jgi:hypothetical protein
MGQKTDSSNWWQTDNDNDGVPTSPDLWRPLKNAFGGFDLDPASGCEPQPIAENRYTKDNDGLSSPWFGTVWLNPPFSDKEPWYRRLVNQYEHGDVTDAAAVATGDPSTVWFHDYFSTADLICFLEGRDWYIGHGSSPSFSTQVGVWNPTDEVIDVLHRLGTVAEPRSRETRVQTSLFD